MEQLKNLYNSKFFEVIDQNTRYSASVILSIIFEQLKPTSVVDIGCGTGVWLSVCKELGANNVVGIDGEYVDVHNLAIDADCFISADLYKPIKLEGRFDLAICLEVAEHLPSTNAKCLIEGITRLSDVVLFSAAIPGQRGTGHLNEQWQDYWVSIFNEFGFTALDCVRPLILADHKVSPWYAQNAFVYCKQPHAMESMTLQSCLPTRTVHHTFYEAILNENIKLKRGDLDVRLPVALKMLWRSLLGSLAFHSHRLLSRANLS